MHTPARNQLFNLTLVAELPWHERLENEELISELLSKNVNDLRQLSARRILQLSGNLLNCSNHTRNSPTKAYQELNISPLSLRPSLRGSPWLFLFSSGIFPSLTCCSLMAMCKRRSFFPTSCHIFYLGAGFWHCSLNTKHKPVAAVLRAYREVGYFILHHFQSETQSTSFRITNHDSNSRDFSPVCIFSRCTYLFLSKILPPC